MNCPNCKEDLKLNGIYKDIEGTILGTVKVLYASEFDSDEEDDDNWHDSTIMRDHSGRYQCSNCGAGLDDEVVWAHFRGDDKATYRDTLTINMFEEK